MVILIATVYYHVMLISSDLHYCYLFQGLIVYQFFYNRSPQKSVINHYIGVGVITMQGETASAT